ncbi:uncharacterized protein LOC6537624 isoform X6 [Drosophila yakuba]|uniref:uncharacterized protein LOC6537624 isoform X6 n=1 Tax=Drosophila yakuba TaxID=7245 RepID=UPI0019307DC8|nr:uncharacterized protein LOC6537624 isoform X6 [Drosophila yakuba]
MRSWKSRSRSKMQTLETRTRLLQGAQLTQLLLGAILCLTIASHTQTSAEAAGGRASGPGADRTSQGAGTSSASASASAASMAISSDESGDPSSATAFSSLAQVSSLLPEASALSATSGLVEPYLDGYATSNVTTQIGTHAYLPCRVKQLGNKSVSWIRLRDGHILTVDRAVFIADQRFLAIKQPDKYWTLQIKYVQARDAGSYECQVSTEPKVSARVQLQVVASAGQMNNVNVSRGHRRMF